MLQNTQNQPVLPRNADDARGKKISIIFAMLSTNSANVIKIVNDRKLCTEQQLINFGKKNPVALQIFFQYIDHYLSYIAKDQYCNIKYFFRDAARSTTQAFSELGSRKKEVEKIQELGFLLSDLVYLMKFPTREKYISTNFLDLSEELTMLVKEHDILPEKIQSITTTDKYRTALQFIKNYKTYEIALKRKELNNSNIGHSIHLFSQIEKFNMHKALESILSIDFSWDDLLGLSNNEHIKEFLEEQEWIADKIKNRDITHQQILAFTQDKYAFQNFLEFKDAYLGYAKSAGLSFEKQLDLAKNHYVIHLLIGKLSNACNALINEGFNLSKLINIGIADSRQLLYVLHEHREFYIDLVQAKIFTPDELTEIALEQAKINSKTEIAAKRVEQAGVDGKILAFLAKNPDTSLLLLKTLCVPFQYFSEIGQSNITHLQLIILYCDAQRKKVINSTNTESEYSVSERLIENFTWALEHQNWKEFYTTACSQIEGRQIR